MRTFQVNVNGALYEIEVEEIANGAAQPASAPAARKPIPGPRPAAARPAAPAPKPVQRPVAAPAAAAAPAGKGEQIKSPMPGNILDVRVKDGDSVKAGAVLMILEAMKMENEILSPCDGVVSSVSVHKGATVSSGSLLCVVG